MTDEKKTYPIDKYTVYSNVDEIVMENKTGKVVAIRPMDNRGLIPVDISTRAECPQPCTDIDDCEYGSIPSGWEKACIGKCCALIPG